jgi:hypothetical protein
LIKRLVFLLLFFSLVISSCKENYQAHFHSQKAKKYVKIDPSLKENEDSEIKGLITKRINRELSSDSLSLVSSSTSLPAIDLIPKQEEALKPLYKKHRFRKLIHFKSDTLSENQDSKKEVDPYGKWSLLMGLNALPLYFSIFFNPFTLFFLGLGLALGAIVFGIVGIRNYNQHKEKYKSKRNAKIGLIIGLSLFALPMIAFIFLVLAYTLYLY